MNTDKMFETATRKKLFFSVPGIGGSLTILDLWDVDVKPLNAAAQTLDAALVEQAGKVNYLSGTKTRGSSDDKLRRDLIVYIIRTKLEEAEARKLASAERASDLQEAAKISAALEGKDEKSLRKKSTEELQERLKEIQAKHV